MHGAGLRLQNTPPLSVPMRYFLTAPLFAVAAGAVVLCFPAPVFTNRWSPPVIMITHLLTLGFMSMIMFGALSQMIPVLGGRAIARARLVAAVTHTTLTLGAIGLVAALGIQIRLLPAAVALLGSGILVFVYAAGRALLRTPARNASVNAMRFALAALLVTLCLGLALGLSRAGLAPLERHLALVDVHLLWGLVGWVAVLIIGVAYQVVPMFQITPEYPRPIRRALVSSLALALVLASAGALNTRLAVLVPVSAALVGLALAVFAAATLHLQQHRRRKVPDVTLAYWRFAMGLLVLVLVLAAGRALRISALAGPQVPLLIAALAMVGVIQSVMIGMLYKIVPFLVWLHLQTRGVRWMTMKKVLSDAAAFRQFRMHVAAVVLLILSAAWRDLVYAAAFVYIAANLQLEWMLLQALRRYTAKLLDR